MFENRDMVSNDESRWPNSEIMSTKCLKCQIIITLGLFGIPTGIGKMHDLQHFDANAFNMSDHMANHTDVHNRKFLELTSEAILDSGIE